MTTAGEVTRRIPTFNAVVIMALPVAAVILAAVASTYLDGARPLTAAAVAGGWLLAAIYPGMAGYVAARSTTPTLTMWTSAAIATAPVAWIVFRTEPSRGIEPTAPFELTTTGVFGCLSVFVAVLLGIWIARSFVNRGKVVPAFIAGGIVQFVVMTPLGLFFILLPAHT